MEKIELYNLRKPSKKSESLQLDAGKELESLELIAQRIGGDLGMKVRLGEPGKGSFYNTEEVSITLDPKQISENPSKAKFIVAHEGGHRAISRSPKELGLSDEKINELYSQVGFGYTQNVIEDATDNNWIASRFPGVEGYMKENYDSIFSKENAVLSSPEVNEMAQKLGYWPKFSQYGSEILRQWHQKRFSAKLDIHVEQALKKTSGFAKRSISSMPNTKTRDEKEIIEKAQERFSINTNNIWPVVKELINEDIQSENQRQAAQDIKKKIEELRSKQQMQSSSGDKDGNQNLQEEIDKIKKELESKGFSEELQKELIEKISESVKKSTNKDSDEKKGKLKNNGGASDKKEDEGMGEGMDKNKSSKFDKGSPIPMDKLSKELLEKLKEYFDSLPEDKKREIEKKSIETLKLFEDKVNKEIEGKLNEDKPESHTKRDKGKKSSEKKKEAYNESRESDLEEQRARDEKLKELRDSMMSDYEKKRAEVVGMIDYLCLRLRKILRPEDYGGRDSGYPSGQILDISRAMQGEFDVVQKQKMWIRENEPERKDYRFWHLVDLSGSMDGTPIKEAFKGFVVASEAIDRVEDYNSENITIHQGITGFHNRVFEYKNFKERFTKNLENRLAEMLKRPDDNDSGTDTYKGTVAALQNLERNLGTSGNYLLTFTDGAPNYDTREDLKEIINKTKEERVKRKIKLGLIWLGNSRQELDKLLKEYGYDFGLVMPINKQGKGKNFAESLADLLEDIVKNPNKY